MGKFATGKNAIAISDRSGMQFPYSEMVREWNGSWVHISEYEIKQPQLELKVRGGDGTALQNPRPPSGAAGTNPVPALLGLNPLFTTDAGSGIINGAVVPKTDNNWFYFTAASGSATEGNKQGGGTIVTAGPLVLLP